MSTERICQHCNSPNDKGAVFCMSCGKKLDEKLPYDESSTSFGSEVESKYSYGTDLTYGTESTVYPQQKRNLMENKLAFTSVIFGILGMFIIPGLGGLIAVILGSIALMQKKPGYNNAIMGMILGVFSLAFAAGLGIMFYFIFG